MKHGIDRNKIQTHLNTNYLLPYKLFPNLMKFKQIEDEQKEKDPAAYQVLKEARKDDAADRVSE